MSDDRMPEGWKLLKKLTKTYSDSTTERFTFHQEGMKSLGEVLDLMREMAEALDYAQLHIPRKAICSNEIESPLLDSPIDKVLKKFYSWK